MFSVDLRRGLPLLFALAACANETTEPGTPPADAGIAPDPDSGVTIEDAGTTPDAGLIVTTTTATEPSPFVVDRWLVGFPQGGTDPVIDRIENGTFVYPEVEGFDDDRVRWQFLEPDNEQGRLTFGGRLGYAVHRFVETEPRRFIVRTERSIAVYLNGVQQPSDVYGSRRHRVPMISKVGENLLILRGGTGRQEPEIQVWTTPDEVFFNTADITRPDLVLGDDSEQYYGLPVLNLTTSALSGIKAKVVENQYFHGTVLEFDPIAATGMTQLGFQLRPKAGFVSSNENIPIRMQIEADGLRHIYEYNTEITTVSATATAVLRTFLSPADRSVQTYAMHQPSNYDENQPYGLILSLHGAGVFARGQARSYRKKDWAFLVAPTNRRRFGFDWEEWGHLNGLNTMRDVMDRFPIDPARMHVTGHSMGGHGTWHFGVMHPGLFGVVAPSAGWSSFYSYGGSQRPTGPFARSRAHSDTNNYVNNLSQRQVYILHGDADNNVPVSEARGMRRIVEPVAQSFGYHEQPGAGHWWNGDRSDGVDCVDWPPFMELMEMTRIDPFELGFTIQSPSPSYQPDHSYVHVQSTLSPLDDFILTSTVNGNVVTLDTDNVRSMVLDGDALTNKGIQRVMLDGNAVDVTAGPIQVGPTNGKRDGLQGPFNQVFHAPFCYVYRDEDSAYARYAAYQSSYWNIYGNGHACALPLSKLTPEIRAERNLIYLGLTKAEIGANAPNVPINWDNDVVTREAETYTSAAVAMLFADGDRLGAVMATTLGAEGLLYQLQPFTSRSGMPDYIIWQSGRLRATGFFDSSWGYDRSLGVP